MIHNIHNLLNTIFNKHLFNKHLSKIQSVPKNYTDKNICIIIHFFNYKKN
jgi:hypothetical protein